MEVFIRCLGLTVKGKYSVIALAWLQGSPDLKDDLAEHI